MKIAVASKIRNEIDIIRLFLLHLDSLFDMVYILDHKSKDGTTDLLKEAVSQRENWEYLFADFNGHFHKQVSNILMKKAFSDGADYLFNLDGDEFIDFKSRSELEKALKSLDNFNGVGVLNWKDCIPCDFEISSFASETEIWCPSHSSQYTKVIVPRRMYDASNHTLYITQGNHHACDVEDNFYPTLNLGKIIHVPIRSRAQAEKKTIIKVLAYLAIKDRNKGEGFHNFEMLSKIADGELDDATLRGFTYLYERERSIISLSEKDLMDRGYFRTTLNKLGVQFSQSLKLPSPNTDKTSNTVIADALLNWTEEDPNQGDFILDGHVLKIIPRSHTEKINPIGRIKDIGKKVFNKSKRIAKGLIPNRLRSFVTNKKFREVILKSELFDSDWYLDHYPDVKSSQTDPITHYLLYGFKEGRNPGPAFDVERYYAENRDLKINKTNPLIHYIVYGKAEGRRIYPVQEELIDNDEENKSFVFRTIENPLSSYPDREERLMAMRERVKNISIDVVICVHNALPYVKKCLTSVIPTLREKDKIILVDDQSNLNTKNYLRKLKETYSSKIKLIETTEQSFYTKSASIGLNASDADFTILLNSDTEVGPNWSVKMVYVAFLDPSIGIVGALSNAANLQSIPTIESTHENTAINRLIEGETVISMNQKCEEWANDMGFPVVPFAHGFCLGIKRELIETIGLFDTFTFPKGFGEETDYCFRAQDAGFLILIATNTFIFHAKSRSYKTNIRKELMNETYSALQNKYSDFRVEQAHEYIKHNPILKRMRNLSTTDLDNNDDNI